MSTHERITTLPRRPRSPQRVLIPVPDTGGVWRSRRRSSHAGAPRKNHVRHDATRSVSRTRMRMTLSTSALSAPFVGRKPERRVTRSWGSGGGRRSRQRCARRTRSVGGTQTLAWRSKPSSCAWRGPQAVTWAKSGLSSRRRRHRRPAPPGTTPGPRPGGRAVERAASAPTRALMEWTRPRCHAARRHPAVRP
jgi:hypothetical protein